jgi:hypothetical protein
MGEEEKQHGFMVVDNGPETVENVLGLVEGCQKIIV